MNLFTTLSDVLGNGCTATITITCVDNVASRIAIGKWLRKRTSGIDDTKAIYWLDFGNQLDRGQVF